MRSPGVVVVRRDVWHGRVCGALACLVIEDTPEQLAVLVRPGAHVGFADDGHPLGPRPWRRFGGRWQEHEVVMVQRPGMAHSVWFFPGGRTYVNLQDPMRRTAIGFDTFDHELDIVVDPEGRWSLKDEDALASAVERGRFTIDEGAAIHAEADRVVAMLCDGTQWWDSAWGTWQAPPGWPVPSLPDGWDAPEIALRASIDAERDRVQRQITSLAAAFDEIVESSRLTPPDDEHDPDGATVAFERAQVAALLAQARRDEVALDDAGQRIDDGRYGICERCGRSIGVDRLEALPAATRCVQCAAEI